MLIFKQVFNLLKFYGNKSILSHTSTLHNNNNSNIKTLIAQDHQIRIHLIVHTSGTQLHNQQKSANISIMHCIEDHSS